MLLVHNFLIINLIRVAYGSKGHFSASLQYLIAIAEYSSQPRATAALHVSRLALSRQIRQLEKLLRPPLVDRHGRAIQLTNAGEIYLRHAVASGGTGRGNAGNPRRGESGPWCAAFEVDPDQLASRYPGFTPERCVNAPGRH